MNPRLTPLLALPIALASCSTGEMPSYYSTYEDLSGAYAKPTAKFSKVEVACAVLSDQGLQKLPAVTLSRGRSGGTRVMKELIYPTSYEYPEIPSGDEFGADSTLNSYPITPANPTSFDVTNVGWTLDLRARPQGSFIMIEGTLTRKKAGPQLRAAGIPFQPIAVLASDALGRKVPVILTENRAEQPTIITTDYPVRIAATPGGEYTLSLGSGQTATFTVNVPR